MPLSSSPSSSSSPSFPSSSSSPSTLHDWRALHADVEARHYCGAYGGANAAYHGLAGVRAGVDMSSFHSKRSPYESFVSSLEGLLKDERTRRNWDGITTLDPLGMFATRPTISATEAVMSIPELQQGGQLEADPLIVNTDLTIKCVKTAVDFVWNLPLLARRLQMDEKRMRQALADSTQNPLVNDPSYNTYLPPVGGVTLYFVGDINKLRDSTTEVAVRVHDECSGSDTFGTSICTCRPYLVFAIRGAVQCAQRGGVGLIAYFRKEGRSLGENIKFRVYNARKGQPGGDSAANYFKVTESIAGIRDARLQEMMPDVLLWLGIERIDWLLSMSSEKYDAIIAAGIDVRQRVSLPDDAVPKDAVVEITAKISAGYHSESIDPDITAHELRSLTMVRARCSQIYALSKAGKSKHFSLDLSRLDVVVDFVMKITLDTYPTIQSIPYHSRWRHFNQKDIDEMVSTWHCDDKERVRRLIDLVLVSVLLDAGAGDSWHFTDAHGNISQRSEGLAIATFEMFRDGLFSSDHAVPHRVNGLGLKALTLKNLTKGLQINEANPITGLDGRYKLLKRIGKALQNNHEFFGFEVCRFGNVLDYVLSKVETASQTVSLKVLWKCVIEGLEGVWPQHLSGVRRGDVWSYSALKQVGHPGSDLIPFHKLSMWLTYSLLEPIESLGIRFTDLDQMTALAEYRNGGLLVDMGVIVPKRSETLKMEHDAGSELVVEWRALTICLIDEIWERARARAGLTKEQFPLVRLLQGGTWTAGRTIAQQLRPNRSSPILVRSDGTVF